jgi:hypothetical protein
MMTSKKFQEVLDRLAEEKFSEFGFDCCSKQEQRVILEDALKMYDSLKPRQKKDAFYYFSCLILYLGITTLTILFLCLESFIDWLFL